MTQIYSWSTANYKEMEKKVVYRVKGQAAEGKKLIFFLDERFKMVHVVKHS